MITPTQAQIEAAKKAFWDTWPSFQEWWLSVDDTYGGKMTFEVMPEEPLEAALTAAAEVDAYNPNSMPINVTEIEAATIERCAQVAEAGDGYVDGRSRRIAAAIRALKEKP